MKRGIYQHYKGSLYNVIGNATEITTGQKLVVYNSMQDNKYTWLRPLEMYEGMICLGSGPLKRFKFVTDDHTIYLDNMTLSLYPSTQNIDSIENFKISLHTCGIYFDESKEKINVIGFGTHTEEEKNYVICHNSNEDPNVDIDFDKLYVVSFELFEKKYRKE